MPLRFTGLWRHADFLRLWAGQSVSLFGSQITLLALPLTAALVLHATATEMGVLAALETLPFALLGLPAGVWIDRVRRRPVMIAADIGRVLCLASVPLAALLGRLHLAHLYFVAFAAGVCTLFFDLAYQSFLPSLVGSDALLDGNARLEVSRSVAQIGGPSLGGLLVQTLSAPFALIVDALSFAVSALCLAAIAAPEAAHPRAAARPHFLAEIAEGLRVVRTRRWLRAIMGCSGTLNFATFMQGAVFVLYATQALGITPGLLGLILACGGPGALVGALLSPRVVRRLGIGPTIITGATLQAGAGLCVPLTGAVPQIAVPLLMGGQFAFGIGLAVYGINQLSLRQLLVPPRFHGRMNASLRVIVTGAVPFGALLGGYVGERFGLLVALWIGGFLNVLAVGWVLWSPLREMHATPTAPEEIADRDLPAVARGDA